MSEAVDKIIQALKTVPAKRLIIFDILNQVTGSDGQLDCDLIRDRQKDINLAEAEARTYVNATQKALEAIEKLGSPRDGRQNNAH